MIDIIIPAYNSHKTIIKTLSSIAMQLNKDNLKVTIVNDGGENYNDIIEIFKPLLNIREIGYEGNKSPGYARQYGIDNTSEEYIVFIDADDTFYESSSIGMLEQAITFSNAQYVISPFIQLGKEIGQQVPVNPNLVWVFGHIYRRKFLEKYNIRFTPTRANEDVGFNTMCNLIARAKFGDDGGKILEVPTYQWHYNHESITRRGKDEYEFGICTPGYIYNLHNAYDVAQREGVELKEIAKSALETFFGCYIYYCIALFKKVSTNVLESIEELSRKFYYDYYDRIQKYISEDEYNQIYSKSYNDKMAHSQGVIFKKTLDDFIKLMKSKKPNDKTYYDIEKNIIKSTGN